MRRAFLLEFQCLESSELFYIESCKWGAFKALGVLVSGPLLSFWSFIVPLFCYILLFLPNVHLFSFLFFPSMFSLCFPIFGVTCLSLPIAESSHHSRLAKNLVHRLVVTLANTHCVILSSMIGVAGEVARRPFRLGLGRFGFSGGRKGKSRIYYPMLK